MPPSVGPVVSLLPISYLCGGLAPRFLSSSSDFLLARNIEKPTTTHQPTTGQSFGPNTTRELCFMAPLQTGGRPKT